MFFTRSPLRPCRRQFPRVMPLSKPGKSALSIHVTVCLYRCPASHVMLASCCWVRAADSETSPEREKTLELIRYLVPDVLNGALVDSLSGHALSAAGLAASFLLEANEQAQLTAPPTSICSVIKAQTPGWFFVLFFEVTSKRILGLEAFLYHRFILVLTRTDIMFSTSFSRPQKVYTRDGHFPQRRYLNI